ncbi:unnamed protein product [Spirodela intermedia]|uniref:Peroxidase n=1 Tax=Spirodela intermedia TaxID=51605 RepID=A0A7I8KU98_SPIIN|nr:unnamed protein product [Spirodela intermedia]
MGLWKRLSLVVAFLAVAGMANAQLRTNFYRSTCPNVESIVRGAVQTKVSQTFVTIPATLRLFFHDCFVEGCDASVVISSPNGDAEKDAQDNLSLAGDGFDTVVKAKAAVEASCPGVVSCADILALAARDVVVAAGGPGFPVELGRRDGLISKRWRVPGNLPPPNFNLNLLSWIFRKNNLTTTDMIALSGAHTVGFAHCNRFSNRIYSNPIDPTLNPAYAQQLRQVGGDNLTSSLDDLAPIEILIIKSYIPVIQMCPVNVDPRIAINMDPDTPNTFDNVYFRNLVNGKGLFSSDQVLFTSPISRGTVINFANSQSSFFNAFTSAMVKLGRTGVKTGNQGEIRRDCTRFN